MIENFRINFRGIAKHFGKTLVLEDTALSLASHDFVVITGENGAGKTTLLRIIAGLEKPDRCDISIDDGKADSWRRLRKRLLKTVMYLHQQPYMLAGSLRRNIEYAARLNPAVIDRDSAVTKAIHWLRRYTQTTRTRHRRVLSISTRSWAGLEKLESQDAASLSGGQKQRVALARARLRDPQILLLDEPTANLDSESRGRTMQMLKEFRDSGTAIVIVTHDPDIFEELATARLHLLDHRVRSEGSDTPEVVELDAVRQSHKR